MFNENSNSVMSVRDLSSLSIHGLFHKSDIFFIFSHPTSSRLTPHHLKTSAPYLKTSAPYLKACHVNSFHLNFSPRINSIRLTYSRLVSCLLISDSSHLISSCFILSHPIKQHRTDLVSSRFFSSILVPSRLISSISSLVSGGILGHLFPGEKN